MCRTITQPGGEGLKFPDGVRGGSGQLSNQLTSTFFKDSKLEFYSSRTIRTNTLVFCPVYWTLKNTVAAQPPSGCPIGITISTVIQRSD